MFGMAFSNIPAKYVFAGYSVRKSVTIMTNVENGKIVYDTFLYTYIDNYLSFYLLMDNGKYKNVAYKVEVPELKAEDLMSKHLSRGRVVDLDEYNYDKDKIIGVFGLRNIEDLMHQVDDMKKKDNTADISLEAMLDVKPQYMGVEINGIIASFNKYLHYDKGMITIPALKIDENDKYQSIIGDELDFYDFMSNKDSDTIVRDLKNLSEALDGVGNIKEGKEVIITKGDENSAGSLEIKDAHAGDNSVTMQDSNVVSDK